MTLDEFKALKKGNFLEYPGMAPSEIVSVFEGYEYRKPEDSMPKKYTYCVEVEDGRTLKLSDPPEWIENTLAHKQLTLDLEK